MCNILPQSVIPVMGVILTHMWHIVMGSVAVLDSVLRVGIRNGCRGRKI